ncbi:MAG: hypothetical protein EXR72_04505 [Myxococcales bacterium]|nr:hypothetical protein [Myxococcales bacterium]
MRSLLVFALVAGCSSHPAAPDGGATAWLEGARILVPGEGVQNQDCRTAICQHNENTDLVVWKGAIYLVHRSARSQILGPNSALHIYRTTDEGKRFEHLAVIPAPADRDLRDPHFYVVGDELFIKALIRKPITSARDSFVDTVAVISRSKDGVAWSALTEAGPTTWSFWRIVPQAGRYYSAAYEDGDKSVVLFSSKDGLAWTRGALIYGIAEDTPLETELTFFPSGRLLALVRMDGTDKELLGTEGRLRTKVCWAEPPYDKFTCPDELTGQRLDGPLSFFWKNRLFSLSRKHLPTGGRKRTALFELTGMLDGGPIAIKEWGEVPSAGDTAYAGAAAIDGDRFLVTWYSGDLVVDDNWARGILDATDIWQATIDFSRLQ